MDKMLDLRDLLQHEIDDLYSAEEQIIEALPKMMEKATNPALRQALNQHLQVTKGQKDRLDKVRKLLEAENKEPGFLEKIFGPPKCKGTEGLIKEGEKLMKEDMESSVRDAAIIASAQKIEHYEISSYGTARAYAMQLGLSEVESLLTATLNEEYEADDSLTALAFFDVNLQAEHGDSLETAKPSRSGKQVGKNA
jgi:ferritin-like metal-binding protein YciE